MWFFIVLLIIAGAIVLYERRYRTNADKINEQLIASVAQETGNEDMKHHAKGSGTNCNKERQECSHNKAQIDDKEARDKNISGTKKSPNGSR